MDGYKQIMQLLQSQPGAEMTSLRRNLLLTYAVCGAEAKSRFLRNDGYGALQVRDQ